MKTAFLLAALLAATASAQTVPRLEPADTSPIIQAPETDPTHGAIIPAEGITLEERAEDGNDTEAMPSLFRHEFNLPGSADDEDRIHCGGDVREVVGVAKIPKNAIKHIQNSAPGPPATIAAEMPAIFPIPTREAVEIISA